MSSECSSRLQVESMQHNHCWCSVAQSCPTLCDPMDCSMPGFPVLQPSAGACSNSLSWWCHPIILSSVISFSSCLLSFPASRSFPVSQFFTSGGQSIEASASASVLPMNIQHKHYLLTGYLKINVVIKKKTATTDMPLLTYRLLIST